MERQIMLSDLIDDRDNGSACWPVGDSMIHILSDYRGFSHKATKAEVIEALGGDKSLDEIAEILREKLKNRLGSEDLVHAIITGCRARIIVSKERAKELLGQVFSRCLSVTRGEVEKVLFPYIMKISDEEVQALIWQLNANNKVSSWPEVDCLLRVIELGRGEGLAVFPLQNTNENRRRYSDSRSSNKMYYLSVEGSKFLPAD